jgi:hypothetical protein
VHFDSVSSLWFGLVLPAIVLLYLFKQTYVDTPVSSHLLWSRALKEAEANRPWQKLRSRLLLFVQLLVAALLMLALMQPWVWSERKAKAHVVAVLDRSASMTAMLPQQDGRAGESRLDMAKRQLLDWAEDEASGSAITLLAMGGQAEVLLSRETSRERLRQALDGLEPDYGKTAYTEALSLAAALTRDDPDAEVRLFTDGRFAETVEGVGFTVPVSVAYVEDAGVAGSGNASVVQFGVQSGQGEHSAASAVASVRNWGEAARQIDVSLYAEEDLAAVRSVHVEPGRTASVRFDGIAPADWYRVEIAPADAMPADDVSYAFAEGERARHVLLVGEGNLFLEKALRLAGAEVTKLAPGDAEAWISSRRPEADPDLIVLDSVSAERIESPAWRSLLAEKPVLNVASGLTDGPVAVPYGRYEVADHPITRYVKLQDTHVYSAFKPPAGEWGEPVVSAGDVPLIYAGETNGSPRVLLAFPLEASDFPLRAEFPVFVQNALEWLTTSLGGSLGRATAGERLETALAPETVKVRWADARGTIPAAEADAAYGSGAPVLNAPSVPGLYRLEELAADGRVVRSRWLGVVPDPAESSPQRTELVFAPQLPEGQPQAAPPAASGAPLHLWRWAVALALAAVIWEWGVYRRGASL